MRNEAPNRGDGVLRVSATGLLSNYVLRISTLGFQTMPTYDYKCTACGHTFDELQSFSAPPLTKLSNICPVTSWG